MKRMSLLATTALCVAGFTAGTTAVSAKTGDIVSRLDVSASYFWWDDSDDDEAGVGVFQGSGAFMKQLDTKWFGQADFAFVSQHVAWDDGGERYAINTQHVGLTGFYRDPTWGLAGIDLAYQSLNDGKAAPGMRIGVRGEYFFSGNASVGGALGYHDISFSYFDEDYDGWYGNIWGKYYFTPEFAVTLRYENANYNEDPQDDELDIWDLSAEGEYLIPDCGTIVYAGVTFGDQDWDPDSFGADEWGLTIGLRWTIGQDGALVERDRKGALAPTLTGLRPNF